MSKITLKEAWDRIVATQNQLGNIERVLFYVAGVREYGEYVEDAESEHSGESLAYSSEVALEKIQAIKEIACTRENTLKKLIDFYMEIYNSCTFEEN